MPRGDGTGPTVGDQELVVAEERAEDAWVDLRLDLVEIAYVHHAEQQYLISWLYRATLLNVQNAECQ